MQKVFEWYLKLREDGKVVVVEKYGWCQERIFEVAINSLVINEDSIVFRVSGVLHRCYFKNYVISTARYPSKFLISKGFIKEVKKNQLAYLYDLIASYAAAKLGVIVELKNFDLEALKAEYSGYCEYISDVDRLLSHFPKLGR